MLTAPGGEAAPGEEVAPDGRRRPSSGGEAASVLRRGGGVRRLGLVAAAHARVLWLPARARASAAGGWLAAEIA